MLRYFSFREIFQALEYLQTERSFFCILSSNPSVTDPTWPYLPLYLIYDTPASWTLPTPHCSSNTLEGSLPRPSHGCLSISLNSKGIFSQISPTTLQRPLCPPGPVTVSVLFTDYSILLFHCSNVYITPPHPCPSGTNH